MDGSIQKYMAFVKTVECGSFTKAAEQLSYSQSGISRMINDLEKEWKVVLLERSKSGVKLTSSGMKLLPYAERVCREYEKLQLEVDELQGLKSGLIRIGTFSSVATHWLPNIIKEFQKNYPNIDYEMLLGDYTDIEEWIMEGRIDCGFTRLPVRDEMDTIFLEQDRLLVVLPEGHPLTELEIFERSNLKPKVHFTTWDDYAIMAMVESGLGISVLPELILKRIPYRIVTRELEIPAYRNIGLAMRNRKGATPAVKRFLEYLQYR